MVTEYPVKGSLAIKHITNKLGPTRKQRAPPIRIVSFLKEHLIMKSLFKCIAIGVFYGVVIAILLNIFSEYISEENEMLFIVGITAVLFPLIDFIAKKLKSNRGIEG